MKLKAVVIEDEFKLREVFIQQLEKIARILSLKGRLQILQMGTRLFWKKNQMLSF